MRNLGAIRGRLRRVFDSPLFALLFLLLNEGRRVTPDDHVPQIALVSQCNAENRHKNTIFINPVISTTHSAFTVPVIERQFWSEKVRKTFSYCMAIFPCTELLTWTRPLQAARRQITFCTLIGQFKPPATRQQLTGWIKRSHLQNTRLLSSFHCHLRSPLHFPPLAWIVPEWCVCWPPVLPS